MKVSQLTWESPRELLEWVRHHEAVHPVARLEDLRQRLEGNRRMFLLGFPETPTRPVAFVNVAFLSKLPSSTTEVVEQSCSIESAPWCIFYSITSIFRGLSGTNVGNLLIKEVAQQFILPGRNFATLSPLPQFRHWLQNQKDLSPELQV